MSSTKLSVPLTLGRFHPVDQCALAARFVYRYRHKAERGECVFESDFNRAKASSVVAVQNVHQILLERLGGQKDLMGPRQAGVWRRAAMPSEEKGGPFTLYRLEKVGELAKDIHAASVALHTAGLFGVCPELVEPLLNIVVHSCRFSFVHCDANCTGDYMLLEQAALHWAHAVREWELMSHTEPLAFATEMCSPLPARCKSSVRVHGDTALEARRELDWEQKVAKRRELLLLGGTSGLTGLDSTKDSTVVELQPALLAIAGLQLAVLGFPSQMGTRIYSVCTCLRTLVVPALRQYQLKLGAAASSGDSRSEEDFTKVSQIAQTELLRSATDALRLCGIPTDLDASGLESLSTSYAKVVNRNFTLGNLLMVQHALLRSESIRPFVSAFNGPPAPPPPPPIPRLSLLLAERLRSSFRVARAYDFSDPTQTADTTVERSRRSGIVYLAAGKYNRTRLGHNAMGCSMALHPPWLLTCVPEQCRSVCVGRLEYLTVLTPSWLFWCPAALCAFLMRGVVFHARLQTKFAYFTPLLRGLSSFVEHVLLPGVLECKAESTADQGEHGNKQEQKQSERIDEVVRVLGVIACCTQSLSLTVSCVASCVDPPSLLERSSLVEEVVELCTGIDRIQRMLGSRSHATLPLHPFFETQMKVISTQRLNTQPDGLDSRSFLAR